MEKKKKTKSVSGKCEVLLPRCVIARVLTYASVPSNCLRLLFRNEDSVWSGLCAYVFFISNSHSHLFNELDIHATFMCTYIYPLFLVTHSLIHKLTQAIMHAYVMPEPQMLSKAKSEGKRAIDYVRTDMSQPMPFRSNVFDTAFSVSAIHYLAGDVPPRSGKARMSTFFRELRRTTSTNANITCQFHEKRGKEKTHKALQDAALESFKASDLVLDQPHETSAQRWFLCLSNNRSSVDKKCPVCWPKSAMCPLIYAKQCATKVSPQHLKWLENDHAKYARRLIRCVNRHLEAPDHPYLPKLSEEEKKLGLKLRDRFGSSVSLETLQGKRLDELIAFLHGYLT